MVGHKQRSMCSALFFTTVTVITAGAAVAQDVAGIDLVGSVSIPGDATDLSQDGVLLENGEPRNRLGGFSALDYSAKLNCFAALSDRGPDDGAVSYPCRVQLFEIDIEPQAAQTVNARHIRTILLKDSKGRPFIGSSAALQPTDIASHRLDPEGLRFSETGTMLISDEYGPEVIEFSMDGVELHRFAVPSYFHVSLSHADRNMELSGNTIGRASNRGLECLALSQDGKRLAGLMQGPLIQDGKFTEDGKILGNNCRLLMNEPSTGFTHEYIYQMADTANGNSEILACGQDQYLVLERDSRSGRDAAYRRLVRIDLTNATDVAGIESISEDRLAASITPAARYDFLDFLDPKFQLAGPDMPEKIEGLSFGPRLRDGRQTLLVATDNDFDSESPSQIWVFALTRQPEKLLSQTFSNLD